MSFAAEDCLSSQEVIGSNHLELVLVCLTRRQVRTDHADWGDLDHMRPLPIVEKEGVLVVTLEDSASINEGQAVVLRQSLFALLESRPEIRVALNLAAIDYISSTGIALLVGLKRRVEAARGKLALFGLHHDVHELFAVMKLVNLFEIAVNEAQAIELLSPPPSP